MADSKADFKSSAGIKIAIGFITAILITIMFPSYQTIETDYSVGMIWGKEDLIAPFSFPIYKNEADYQRELKEAAKNVLPVFDINNAKASGNINWLDSLDSFLKSLKKAADYQIEFNKEKNLPDEKKTTSDQSLKNFRNGLPISFTDNEWYAIIDIFSGSVPNINYENFKKKLILSLNQAYEKKIINISKSSFTSKKISYIKNRVEEVLDLSETYDQEEIRNILRNIYRDYFKNNDMINAALKISMKYIYPDLLFNKEETDKVISAVTESIPKTTGLVKENEKIVSKHDPITETTKLKLESYRRVRSEQIGSKDYYLQQLGRLLFVMTMLFLIAIFLFKMRTPIFEDNSKLLLISSIILLQCLFSYLSLNIEINHPAEYLIFVPVAAMLLTIIFDSRVAFYTIIIICLLVSAIRGGDYDILIPNFSASVLVIYSVRDIKKRSQIFLSMFYILLGYAVTITAIGLERFENFSVIKNQLYIASLNSVLSPILAYGLLIFYEKVFNVATDLVFLELTDFNHPLLRELSAKAPGTFHHSVVMGNLSEQAAKEIGANQILTRVGCYYHDIGKIKKPDYFVENQLELKSKHEELNPSLSAKMIISHVKYGIELAEKYRIPREVINFIPMHHGTTLVSYFFQKAKSEEMNNEDVHDYIYRYPGPKPQTKETGIVMLADSVEAATRAIEEPSPAKIEEQIDQIIKSRFIEGELDECELTLKDLTKIKNSFLKTLVGIHHHRIKYPEQETEKE